MSISPLLKEYLLLLAEAGLLSESKQNIVNLGFPPIIATILFEKYGQKAFAVAKWFESYHNHSNRPTDAWWKQTHIGPYVARHMPDLKDMVFLYEAYTTGDPKKVMQAREHLGLARDPEYDDFGKNPRTDEEIMASMDFPELMSTLKSEIRSRFNDDIFFNSTFMKDFTAGKISDIKPYSKLGYQATQDKYDTKRIFLDQEPLKVYPNGWKWINAGPKCQLLGTLMKNCGGTGVMSLDPDRTILALFDDKNKPHVMVTWSPNQGRISGDEGVAGSVVKPEYEEFVFDIAKQVGAKFDFVRTKSNSMRYKTIFGSMFHGVEVGPETFSIDKITLTSGEVWWSSGTSFIKETDLRQAAEKENVPLDTEKQLRHFAGIALSNYGYPKVNEHKIQQMFNPDAAVSNY